MDLSDRIQRRRNGRSDDGLVIDWDALSPASHLSEPVGRAALLEAVLDALDPVFDDQLPPSVYLWGPKGSGKSAIVTSVIRSLEEELSSRQPTYTATRSRSAMSGLRYVYLDTRGATSEFKLYHRALDGLTETAVPERGIGTHDLTEAIDEELAQCGGLLLAVDHIGSSHGADLETVQNAFERFDEVSLIIVGRTAPTNLPMPVPSEQIHVPGYTYELIDVLTVRGSRGLSRTLEHSHARMIADWSDGNAHDALGALYIAASIAEEEQADRVTTQHIQAAMNEVPTDGAPLSQLLSLMETERTVLAKLLSMEDDPELEIEEMAERIGSRSNLSSTTVKRMLYELAQAGILRRIQVRPANDTVGRRPSMVKPNFPARAFEHH